MIINFAAGRAPVFGELHNILLSDAIKYLPALADFAGVTQSLTFMGGVESKTTYRRHTEFRGKQLVEFQSYETEKLAKGEINALIGFEKNKDYLAAVKIADSLQPSIDAQAD